MVNGSSHFGRFSLHVRLEWRISNCNVWLRLKYHSPTPPLSTKPSENGPEFIATKGPTLEIQLRLYDEAKEAKGKSRES